MPFDCWAYASSALLFSPPRPVVVKQDPFRRSQLQKLVSKKTKVSWCGRTKVGIVEIEAVKQRVSGGSWLRFNPSKYCIYFLGSPVDGYHGWGPRVPAGDALDTDTLCTRVLHDTRKGCSKFPPLWPPYLFCFSPRTGIHWSGHPCFRVDTSWTNLEEISILDSGAPPRGPGMALYFHGSKVHSQDNNLVNARSTGPWRCSVFISGRNRPHVTRGDKFGWNMQNLD